MAGDAQQPVSNAFIVHDLKTISETAERLGKREDAARTADSLPRRRTLISKKFVSKNGIVAKDYQSAYIMALKYVLPEERNLQNRSGKTLLPTSVKRAAIFCDRHLPASGGGGRAEACL